MNGTRRIAEVDDRGRVSLARYGFKDTQVVIDERPDGSLVITEGVVLTMGELEAIYGSDHVRALERALGQASNGDVESVQMGSGGLQTSDQESARPSR